MVSCIFLVHTDFVAALILIPVIAQICANPANDEDGGGEDVLPLEHVQHRQFLSLLTLAICCNLIEDGINLIYLFLAEFPLVPMGDVQKQILRLILPVVLSQPPRRFVGEEPSDQRKGSQEGDGQLEGTPVSDHVNDEAHECSHGEADDVLNHNSRLPILWKLNIVIQPSVQDQFVDIFLIEIFPDILHRATSKMVSCIALFDRMPE